MGTEPGVRSRCHWERGKVEGSRRDRQHAPSGTGGRWGTGDAGRGPGPRVFVELLPQGPRERLALLSHPLGERSHPIRKVTVS